MNPIFGGGTGAGVRLNVQVQIVEPDACVGPVDPLIGSASALSCRSSEDRGDSPFAKTASVTKNQPLAAAFLKAW
jgi:hypothetical protein